MSLENIFESFSAINSSPLANGSSQHSEFSINLEIQLKEAQIERDEAVEDRDRLFKILERRSMEIERLESESKKIRNQLQESINAKCEAVRKCEEIQQQVTESKFKEKRFMHERTLAQNKIEMLTNDLTKNVQELQQSQKESMLLERKLHEKSSELQTSIMNEAQLREYNEILATKVEELTTQILKNNEDFSVSIKRYKQELSSKSRIVELFKEKSEDFMNVHKELTTVVAEHTESSLSIAEVYSMYVNASEDLDVLNLEHEKLKETLTAVVHEIEERAPEIKDTQIELRNLRKAYQMLSTEYQVVRDEKLNAQQNNLIHNLNQKCMKLQIENKNLSSQVCQLLDGIEDKSIIKGLDQDFEGEIDNVEDNNVKLFELVRELTTVIQQVDGFKANDQAEIPSIAANSNQDELMEVFHIENDLEKSEHDITKYEEMLIKKDLIIKQLSNQLDEIKTQRSDTNFNLHLELGHKEAQLKIQQKNFDMTKKKLQSLEDKTMNLETTVAKLETSLTHLHDELQNCSSKLSESETLVLNLTKENKNLIKLEAELRTENEMHKKQQIFQTQMMSSIELIKVTLERQENVKSLSEMAKLLEEESRKCEELEKMLEDEQKILEEYEIHANATIEELDGELQRLQNKLSMAIQEIDRKSNQIQEKDESTKILIEQAQSIITKLSEENEKLKEKKDEIERKLNELVQKDLLDFISCIGSFSNLEAFVSANDFVDTQNEQTEFKAVAQKRRREDEDFDDEAKNEEIFYEIAAEKRVKTEEVEEFDRSDEQNIDKDEFGTEMNLQNETNVVEEPLENFGINSSEELDDDAAIEENFDQIFSENCDFISID
ncbi:unnamed protein product [Chironomus riparius]|uniref:Uncharacterized protein n=1 Tax=Chironomus riparius TaxID=315576 RepID=A0A9N9WZQ5_9DIPT|nr:unnamed protein product [Chironomus riparius]